MSMHWLITGGSGFVGSALVKELSSSGHDVTVLTRSPAKHRQNLTNVTWVSDLAQVQNSPNVVVNLAGAGIADSRWTQARRTELEDSRIGLTRELVQWLKGHPDAFLVSASAIGIYAHGEVSGLDAPLADNYSGQLCKAWEEAAAEINRPHAVIRISVVLGPGGFMKRMLPLFKLGLGGPIASGEQGLSWIHRSDLVRLFQHVGEHRLAGTFNASAPQPVEQRQFAKALGEVLHRPAFLPTPGFAMKAAFGQMAEELILAGHQVQPVVPEGFAFNFPQLSAALRDVVKR